MEEAYTLITREEFEKQAKRLTFAMMAALSDTILEAPDVMLVVAVLQKYSEMLTDELFSETKEEE